MFYEELTKHFRIQIHYHESTMIKFRRFPFLFELIEVEPLRDRIDRGGYIEVGPGKHHVFKSFRVKNPVTIVDGFFLCRGDEAIFILENPGNQMTSKITFVDDKDHSPLFS